MAESERKAGITISKLVESRRYSELREFVQKRFPVLTPFEMMLETSLPYIVTLLCRQLGTLDEGTVSRMEAFKLTNEEVIALKDAKGKTLDAVLQEISKDQRQNTSPGLLNKLVLEIEHGQRDKVLYRLDRFSLSHIGKKAEEFGKITGRNRGILRSGGYLIWKGMDFKSEDQKKYFLDILKAIYESEVLSKPCMGNPDCERCRSTLEILEEYFGPLDED